MTITEFLKARIAEDEVMARAASHQKVAGPFHGNWRPDSVHLQSTRLEREDIAHIARWDPARVLAECEAKRRIVTEHRPANLNPDGTVVDFSSDEDADYCFGCGANFIEEWSTRLEKCPTLRALAAVYADHPDYQREWEQ